MVAGGQIFDPTDPWSQLFNLCSVWSGVMGACGTLVSVYALMFTLGLSDFAIHELVMESPRVLSSPISFMVGSIIYLFIAAHVFSGLRYGAVNCIAVICTVAMAGATVISLYVSLDKYSNIADASLRINTAALSATEIAENIEKAGYAAHARTLKAEGVDGLRLAHMQRDDLKELGIDRLTERISIWCLLEEMQTYKEYDAAKAQREYHPFGTTTSVLTRFRDSSSISEAV